MKTEQSSETSAYKIQTPGNYPEESTQHSEHSESSQSRVNFFAMTILAFPWKAVEVKKNRKRTPGLTRMTLQAELPLWMEQCVIVPLWRSTLHVLEQNCSRSKCRRNCYEQMELKWGLFAHPDLWGHAGEVHCGYCGTSPKEAGEETCFRSTVRCC
jgi:hypothetical protein